MEWVASLAGCIKSRANTYINRWMEVEFIVATASTYQYLFNSLFFHIAADPGIASSHADADSIHFSSDEDIFS